MERETGGRYGRVRWLMALGWTTRQAWTIARAGGIVRGGRAYCNGACLNGRRSCDCSLCYGRCHGAGTCPGH